MPYQFKREPLTQDEATQLANACATHEEKLVAWTLLDTGLRVSELASLTKDNLDAQTHRLMAYGKGGSIRNKIETLVLECSQHRRVHFVGVNFGGISKRTPKHFKECLALDLCYAVSSSFPECLSYQLICRTPQWVDDNFAS